MNVVGQGRLCFFIWTLFRFPSRAPVIAGHTVSGHCFILVHMETTVSGLYLSLSVLEVGFVIRCGRPGSCVRPRHSSSNRVSTNMPLVICVVFLLSVSQLTAGYSVWCYYAEVYDHLGFGRLVDCYSAAVVIVI